MDTLGNRLKQARQNINKTQKQIAKMLGISIGTLSGYERDYRDPDTETLNKLAEIYGVSTDYLLGRSDKEAKLVQKTEKLTEKDEKDIAKRLEQFRKDIEGSDGLAFDGEPLSDEAKESVIEAMEYILRTTKRINKKYTPKKYRKDDVK